MNLPRKLIPIIFVVFMPSLSGADSVQELNQSELLSIQEYRVKATSMEGERLHKTISVVAVNSTHAPLHNVYLYLDGMPSHVSGGGWAYFPELGIGIVQESATTVDYVVDLSRQVTPDLELIWQIKAEIDGKQIIDEIAVKEILR